MLSLLATWTVALDARAAAPAVTSLTSEGFTGRTTAENTWFLPPASGKPNGACLTAGTDTTQAPVRACRARAVDSGPGTLRLTANDLNVVGTVYNTTSLPTSQGLDVRFASYQWASAHPPGADGIGFVLAATDPSNPSPPATTGPVGGSLGYSAAAAKGATPAQPGVANGYLGFGLDVYGNFRSSSYGGTGCATSTSAPQNVTVRGPGNGTSGYCIAGTQQVTAGTLDARSATSRPAPVPVEIALNPAADPTTSLGGVAVPARSWMIAFTPVGGSQQTMTGALPTAAALQSFGYPASYYDPDTGLPYQLTFGWSASTGGNDEIHEINNLVSSTLNGQLPDLDVGLSDNQGGALLADSPAVLTVTPTLDPTQGPENRPVTVTTTFPAGLTPTTPTSAGYACSTAGQVVTCTHTPTSPIEPGQALPVLDVPVQVGSVTTSGLSVKALVSSTDANPAQATRGVSVVGFGARATPARTAYGSPATLWATGLPQDATGVLTFASGGTTWCTTELPTTSCDAPALLEPGTYPVLVTYGGDAAYTSRSASTSLEVTRAAPGLTAGVSAERVAYGTPVVLSYGGLPAAATGSVTFTAGGTTLCVVDDVTTASSCGTSSGLDVGSYPVTARYSGDARFAATTATTSFSVALAPVDLHAAVSQETVPYGAGDTLSVAGLPADATGTVRFVDAEGALLCGIDDVAVTGSCQIPTGTDTGTYAVTARYFGDARHAPAEAGTTFTVVRAATALVAAVSDPSVPFGTTSTLSFSGLPAAATGTVTFTSGARTLCVVDVDEAASCASPDDLGRGEHPVTAAYGGDRHHEPSSATTALTVTAAGSPSFAAAVSDPTPTYGTPDTLSFSGLVPGATGSVRFTAGGRTLCEVADVTAASSCTTAADLDAAGYDVTAAYSGDDDHDAASAAVAFEVRPAATTLWAAVAADPLDHGLAQTLSFGGLPGAATGPVRFTDASGAVLCRVPDVTAASSCSTSATLRSGAYAVTARYPGDPNHRGSSADAAFVVRKAATALTAGTSAAEVPYGTAETLSHGGLPAAATGAVTFSAGDRVLCTVEDVTAADSCSAPGGLPVGPYEVTATYAGDAEHEGSTATTRFVVTLAPTDLSASVGRPTVPWGSAETLGFGGLPVGATGRVTFAADGVTLCTVEDVTAASTCTGAAGLATGRYAVTATYGGDERFAGSTATTSFTVERSQPALDLTTSTAGVRYGTAATLTFGGLPPTATGSVVFTSRGRTLCTVPDVTLTRACATADDLAVGVYPVLATYGGDERFAPVTASTGFSVVPVATSLVVSPRTPQVTHGSAQALLVSGLPAGAGGTVTFTSGDRALCEVRLGGPAGTDRCETGSDLPVGTYPVRAVYSGDASHEASEASTTFDVVRSTVAGFTATVEPGRTTYGVPVTLAYAGLPPGAGGTVRFTVDDADGALLCSVVVGDDDRCRTPASLEPGGYAVLATYSGDAGHEPAAVPLELTVAKAPTQVEGDHEGDAVAGSDVVLVVGSLPDGATGTVVLSSGGTALCTVALPATRCTTTALTAGTQTVRADYSGDDRYEASTATFDVEVAAPGEDDSPGGDDPGGDGSGSGAGSGGTDPVSDGPGSTDHHGSLASTGGPAAALLVGGLLLLAAGSGTLSLGRRRSPRR
ncbi:hypothetical protein GCM10022197_23510 [Microlunatus spumicola]|uniref:Bacterial Ig-like domain-containing protein n=1 Tax=Microlunatus spumicola TaxID=81499 RepID=A0ABP6XIJ0_9ACTN